MNLEVLIKKLQVLHNDPGLPFLDVNVYVPEDGLQPALLIEFPGIGSTSQLSGLLGL